MMNLEALESSYNRIQQRKVLAELDKIDEAKDKYYLLRYKHRANFYEKKEELKKKIVYNKALLKEFKMYKHERSIVIKNQYKQDIENLKEVRKFALEEENRNYYVSFLKYKENYKRYLDLYSNKPQELEEFKSKYQEFMKSKKQELLDGLNKRKAEIKVQFNNGYVTALKKKNEDLANINEEYLKLISKGTKEEYLQEIKKAKTEIKEAKQNKTILEKQDKNSYLNEKSEYERVKKEANTVVKGINKDSEAYYSSLSNEKKKEYKYFQRYINEDYKMRFFKKKDELERRIFKKINPAYLYVGPSAIAAVFFTVLPFIFMLIAAFFKLDLTTITDSRFVYFDNFVSVFTRDTEFQKAIYNTVIYAFFTFVLLTIISVLMAMWLSKNTRIHNIAQTMVFTPHIASLVSISILWIAILNPSGILNQILGWFGIEGPGWLVQENTALLSVSFVTVWKDIGYYVLIIIAGLQGIPTYVYEAAKLDKSKKSTTFFKITLPLLVPTLTFVFITKFINSFKVFAPIEIMTNGGPMGASMVLSYWIYKVGRIGYNYGNAMAGAIVLTIMIAICTFINYKLLNRKKK